MKTVLVTGATGMIGANVCKQLIDQGDRVRAIVRKPEAPDAVVLGGLGVDVVPGDIADLDAVLRATEGVDGVIHSAALRGVPGATIANSLPPNVIGTINVLTAAWMVGGPPVVHLLTSTFFNTWDAPRTEVSPLDLLFRNKDPYSVTKRLAYLEGFARATRAGHPVHVAGCGLRPVSVPGERHAPPELQYPHRRSRTRRGHSANAHVGSLRAGRRLRLCLHWCARERGPR